jgi:retron-type reverse transcriptase
MAGGQHPFVNGPANIVQDTLSVIFRGSAGVEHESVERFVQRLEENITRLSDELRMGIYRPRPIKRAYIDKPGSK